MRIAVLALLAALAAAAASYPLHSQTPVATPQTELAARGESPAAFGWRCIPAGCVAPRSNTPGIAPHRAQDARWGPRSALVAPLCRGPHGADCAPWVGTSGRIATLGATLDFHQGLPGGAAQGREPDFEKQVQQQADTDKT